MYFYYFHFLLLYYVYFSKKILNIIHSIPIQLIIEFQKFKLLLGFYCTTILAKNIGKHENINKFNILISKYHKMFDRKYINFYLKYKCKF